MNLNNVTLPSVEALKEAARYTLLVAVSAGLTVAYNYACDYLGFGIKLPVTESALAGGTFFRTLDKFMHELGKVLSTRKTESPLVKGLTQF